MTAASRAADEVAVWVAIAEDCRVVLTHDVEPVAEEAATTGFDPSDDLDRRARRWQHRLADHGLVELARFAAGLAQIESERWASDDAIVATRAHEDRRFLFGDRIVHWAVPWADMAGRCHHDVREEAHRIRDRLLELGDHHRVAPLLTGDEGLYPPGEDSLGPVEPSPVLGLLGGGLVTFRATVRSLTGGAHTGRLVEPETLAPSQRSDLAELYRVAAGRWAAMSRRHPGTARLWRDLSGRAAATAARIGGHESPEVDG